MPANGFYPLTTLTRMPDALMEFTSRGTVGQYADPEFARRLTKWAQLCEADGAVLLFNEIYRDFAGQEYQYQRMLAGFTPTAARPGTSVHGEGGRAVDIAFTYGSSSSDAYATIVRNAHKVGLGATISSEVWHFATIGATTVSLDITPFPTIPPAALVVYEEEENMFVKTTGIETGYIPVGWTFQLDGTGCWRALSSEETKAVEDAKYPIVEMYAKDVYNHTLKGGLREYSGDMHSADPGFQSGRILFGYDPQGGLRAVGEVTNPNHPLFKR